jgi:organic hydroperoxide reductase OsmC/OhrA
MVVIASRQAGQRPETIRTRLARFMPRGAAPAWSVAWSARTARPDEIASEDQLAVADHVGCFGAAVAHALGRADLAPTRLRVSADAAAAPDSASQPFTVEVRAAFARSAVEAELVESIVRRADPMCPIWNSLATEDRVRIVAVVESSADGATPAASSESSSKTASAPPLAAPMPVVGRSRGLNLQVGPVPLPTWLTPRFAGLLGVAIAVLAFTQHPWAG